MRVIRAAAPLASLCLLAAGCGGAGGTPAGCVKPDLANPASYDGKTAKVGQLVYVAQDEPAGYLKNGYPRGFPWARAFSSRPAVLEPVALCQERGAVSTLPVAQFAFRAIRPGKATLRAPLADSWRMLKFPAGGSLHAYSRTVTVEP